MRDMRRWLAMGMVLVALSMCGCGEKKPLESYAEQFPPKNCWSTVYDSVETIKKCLRFNNLSRKAIHNDVLYEGLHSEIREQVTRKEFGVGMNQNTNLRMVIEKGAITLLEQDDKQGLGIVVITFENTEFPFYFKRERDEFDADLWKVYLTEEQFTDIQDKVDQAFKDNQGE